MPKPPSAARRPASLLVAGILLLELVLPTAPAIAGGPPAPSTEPEPALGIAELGYDPDWVTPAQPAPITVPGDGGAAGGGDPSIQARPVFGSTPPPATRTEVPELRTERSITYANPDGTFSQVGGQSPQVAM